MELIDRYPGLRQFNRNERDLFFGRMSEVSSLMRLIKTGNVIVLFSKSGLGKSSLINAGLLPQLEEENFYPIVIRMLQLKKNPYDILFTALSENLCDFKQQGETNGSELLLQTIVKLIEKFKNKKLVLIFDQFEEFFLHKTEERLRVLNFFLDVNNNVEEINIKILFAIRADKLSLLNELRAYIPEILETLFELLPLPIEKAEQAIVLPAKLHNNDNISFKTPRYFYSEEAIQILLENLGKGNTSIESSQLQIVCQELEKKAFKKISDGKGNKIESNDFNGAVGIQEIQNEFYQNQLKKLNDEYKLNLNEEDMLVIRILIEDKLLTDGRRDMKSEGGVLKHLKEISTKIENVSEVDKPRLILDKLLKLRLLREEQSHLGTMYEISHDTLVDSILKFRQKREEKYKNLIEAELLIKQYETAKREKKYDATEYLLMSAKKIYDKYPQEIQKSINTMLLLAKDFEDQEKFPESKEQLDNILNIINSDVSSHNSLIDEIDKKKNLGLTNERLGILYTKWKPGKITKLNKVLRGFKKEKDSSTTETNPEYYFKEALNNYEEIQDKSNVAKIAEHIAGLKETEFIEKSNEQALILSENYYIKARDFYSKNDLFGYERVKKCLERLNHFYHDLKTIQIVSKTWGYISEIFTGNIHLLKGKDNVRIGRDVYDEQTQTYTIKNEIGFSNKYRLMSRRHVSLYSDLTIEDTQSLNGTTINTFPLYYGNPRKLIDKDIIVLANIMPLQFSHQEPEPAEVPDQCWGIIIDGVAKKYYYLEGLDKIFSVSLVHHKTGYDLKFSDFEEDDALMKFKYSDEEPYFFAEEKMEVTTNINNEGVVEDIMATWKIRTTIKDTDRFYKDYILNTGKWFGAFDFPMQPQLNFIEKKKVKKTDEQGKETEEEIEEEKIYAYGPAFQLILKPEYNPQLRQYFEDR